VKARTDHCLIYFIGKIQQVAGTGKAREAAAEVLRIKPNYSVERDAGKANPFSV